MSFCFVKIHCETITIEFVLRKQEAYPVKLKEVHIINVSPLVDTIINFVRPFLKEKIRQRIHFHSNMDSLYKFVPQKMLPKEYGGEAGTMAELTGKILLNAHKGFVNLMCVYRSL